MTLFLAKLTLTPLIMYLTSSVGRRWGPGISGWLTGLPLLAGPISVFLYVEQGPAFAAHAAGSTILGLWSSCAFCLAYHYSSRKGWLVASASAATAFFAATALLQLVHVSPWIAMAGMIVGASICLRLVRAPAHRPPAPTPPRWDMALRMAIAAAYVLLQTSVAGWLGPQLSGLLIPFPIVVILLTAFAHHQLGAGGATLVLRGFLIGMYAFATFFLVVATLLEQAGALETYLLALLACLALNGAILRLLRAQL